MSPLFITMIVLGALIIFGSIFLSIKNFVTYDKKNMHKLGNLKHMRPVDMTLEDIAQVNQYNLGKIKAIMLPMMLGVFLGVSILVAGILLLVLL